MVQGFCTLGSASFAVSFLLAYADAGLSLDFCTRVSFVCSSALSYDANSGWGELLFLQVPV